LWRVAHRRGVNFSSSNVDGCGPWRRSSHRLIRPNPLHFLRSYCAWWRGLSSFRDSSTREGFSPECSFHHGPQLLTGNLQNYTSITSLPPPPHILRYPTFGDYIYSRRGLVWDMLRYVGVCRRGPCYNIPAEFKRLAATDEISLEADYVQACCGVCRRHAHSSACGPFGSVEAALEHLPWGSYLRSAWALGCDHDISAISHIPGKNIRLTTGRRSMASRTTSPGWSIGRG